MDAQPFIKPGQESAVLTVAMGHAAENLDHTYLSFAQQNPGLPLHAFILGEDLPRRRHPEIHYHLVKPGRDFNHPLREVYFRRLELVDQVGADLVLVVDCFDVLCLQPLPPFSQLLAGATLAGCVEHLGCRYVMGQGYTANFINGGVIIWNVRASRHIRSEILERGRARFRTVADDQYCMNEVIQTKYYDQLRILPCQYNYRCNLAPVRQRGWPSVDNLDGVMIYHNARCMAAAKRLQPVRPRAYLPGLEPDLRPLNRWQLFWRRLQTRLGPHVVK